jgi:hypothetical protein
MGDIGYNRWHIGLSRKRLPEKLECAEFGLPMLRRFGLTLTAIALTAAAMPLPCAAQPRLTPQTSGVGLRQLAAPGPESSTRDDPGSLLSSRQPSGFSLFGGTRELTRSGLAPAETYGGVAYAFPRGWGSTLEAGYIPESALAPRQYALGGEVRTALTDSKSLSVGVRYRVYDVDVGAPGDTAPANGYGLAAPGGPGTVYAPGFQLRLGYQHSAASMFGLALGRDMETVASALDPTVPYPRQLSFTGLHWLTPSWAVSYDVLSGDLASPSPLRLQGLGLRFGVRYQF